MLITSTGNERIKHLKALIKKSSLRKEEGLYVVEGWRAFEEIPKELLCEAFVAESCRDRCSGKNVYIVSDRVIESVSDTGTSQGVIATVKMQTSKRPDYKKGGFFIACERLQDPGNLGTIIRMSEAAGVCSVILSKDTVDLYNPKTVRATMGASFRVPVFIPDDFCAELELMKKAGINVYGAALEESIDYADNDYTHPTAFVIGNEGNGLTQAAKKACTGLVRIPMEGKVESLNASVAAAVLAFEAYRQKRISVRKK